MAGWFRRVWAWVRTRQGARIVIPVAALVLTAAVVVPVGVSQRCSWFESGCRVPKVTFKPLPRQLSPLDAATSGGYVALGDSYSSGEGTWNVSADRAFINGGAEGCHRSGHSYFNTVMATYRFAKGGVLWACSGARVPNLLTGGQRGEPAQLSRITAATTLVTFSIGGNDVGFSKIVAKCVVKLPWSSACRDQDSDIRARLAQLPAGLNSILDTIGRRAPNARIIVLSYPRPFPIAPTHSIDNIGTEDQSYLNGVVHDLDNVIYTTVQQADTELATAHRPGSVEFVDAYQAYTGHELGTAQPYLNGLDFDLGELAAEPRSFHPNASGYQRFGELVNQQIKAGPQRPFYQYRL